MMEKELKKKNNMAASVAGISANKKNALTTGAASKGNTDQAPRVVGQGFGAVPPHGDDAHTGGGGGDAGGEQAGAQTIEAANPEKKGGILGGIGKALTGGLSGLFYKMPAAGSSPIEKNFGSKESRGFAPPTKMSTFGVGASNKEKMGGVGSNLLDN